MTAYVGSTGSKSYLAGSSNDKAANPKNVWKTSGEFPGRSDIPPSISWQLRMYSSNFFWSIQSYLPIMHRVE